MQVILLQRVAKLGQMGEVVNVKDGYARNFLLPQGKALRASEANIKSFEAKKAQLEANKAGWPILRHGTIATHPLVPIDDVPTLLVDYSHFGGDSGSAAVLDDAGRPIACPIHFAETIRASRS